MCVILAYECVSSYVVHFLTQTSRVRSLCVSEVFICVFTELMFWVWRDPSSWGVARSAVQTPEWCWCGPEQTVCGRRTLKQTCWCLRPSSTEPPIHWSPVYTTQRSCLSRWRETQQHRFQIKNIFKGIVYLENSNSVIYSVLWKMLVALHFYCMNIK